MNQNAAPSAPQPAPRAELWGLMARWVVLRAPDWAVVRGWRAGAEPAGGMNPATLDRFLQHYERLTRRAVRTLPARADLLIDLDAGRCPTVRGR